jgi:ATP-dependent RNA helicase DeaD
MNAPHPAGLQGRAPTPPGKRASPAKTFEIFGFSPDLLRGIAELGFTEPTPVQEKVIPLLLKGARDVVALAQTGTGKTAAFGLPLLQLTEARNSATQALVLCPTRELCLQIAKDLADYGRFAPHLKILAVYGGSSIRDQIHALHRGVHIIVATPGRMNDLLRRKSAKLSAVQRVVLDEADEMLNMGFQEELETILKEVPETARTLLFSATMPRQVASMAGKYMKDPEEIIIGQRNAGAPNVTHECYTVHARDRYLALKRIIDCRPGLYGIVFCRTRAETQEVASRLKADGYNSDTLHGDLSQDQRDRVMKAFRSRGIQILVATDVAARGLDVEDLTHIIHYDLPGDLDVYTHRSGRTGRAGKSGVSMALVHMREDFKIRALERILGKPFEHKHVPGGREVLDAQLVCLLERIRKMDVAETAELDDYLPRINEILGDMPREEIVKRFVLGDFNRFLQYYRNAADLNVHAGPGARDGRPDRRDRGNPRERSRDDWNDPNLRRDRPSERGGFDGAACLLRINLGKINGLTVPELIGVINRATPGPMLKLGRIRILEQDSLFEVAAGAEEILIPNLSRSEYKGRPVRCVPERDEQHGAGPRRGSSPPYRERREYASRPGSFAKKKPYPRGSGPRPGGFHRKPASD